MTIPLNINTHEPYTTAAHAFSQFKNIWQVLPSLGKRLTKGAPNRVGDKKWRITRIELRETLAGILAYFAQHADKNNFQVQKSIMKISAAIGRKEDCTRRALKLLEEYGYISVTAPAHYYRDDYGQVQGYAAVRKLNPAALGAVSMLDYWLQQAVKIKNKIKNRPHALQWLGQIAGGKDAGKLAGHGSRPKLPPKDTG